jgi:hypothetical protein
MSQRLMHEGPVTLYGVGSSLAGTLSGLADQHVVGSRCGAGVNPRPQAAQRQRWTVSNFFVRDPLRASAVLPQLGQRPGCLAV